jgi:hypothetical protein
MPSKVADQAEGCEYCQDPANRLLDGMAGNHAKAWVLLECPECGQYYLFHGYAPQWRPAMTHEEAAECFPEAFRHGRPVSDG